MKVGELIKILKGLPQDALVVQSKDAEGNSFSPVADHCESHYVPDTTWAGELWDEDDDEDDEGPPDGAVPCVVLWPTN